MKREKGYIRCRNCGQFVGKSEAVRSYYCSEACSTKYGRCKNCGRFFRVDMGQTEDFCSTECEESWDTPLRDLPHIHQEEEGALI